jgi:branched-chain amino acid transport system permease protein
MLSKARISAFLPVVIGLLLPLGLQDDYLLHVASLVGIYIIVVSGLNVIIGYTGQFMLAPAAFFGIGAYTVGILTTKIGSSFWLALLVGMVLALIVAVIIGLPSLRVRGPYLAFLTLAFGEIFYAVINNWFDLTGGAIGIRLIPVPEFLGFEFSLGLRFYYLVLLFLVISVLLIGRILKSHLGLAFRMTKEGEEAAETLGVNTTKTKLQAFAISAVFMAAGGALYAPLIGLISPPTFTLNFSFLFIFMLILGGQASLIGPIIGAIVIGILPELLREALQYYLLINGLIMIGILLFTPNGLWGILQRIPQWFSPASADVSLPKAPTAENPKGK